MTNHNCQSNFYHAYTLKSYAELNNILL